jgi:hypothetical protein
LYRVIILSGSCPLLLSVGSFITQGGAEPTDTFWHTIIFWHKKGIKWNAQFLSTKQAIYYLFITFDRQHVEGGLLYLQLIVLNGSPNCQKLGAQALDLWSQFHREYHASAPVLCVGDSCIRILSSIRDREVRRPYRPWDTRFMKMLFVAD